MNTLFEVLALVWSVLCLILFFKIWGMTNDVKEIRDFLIDCKKPETIRKPEDGVVKREDTFEYLGDSLDELDDLEMKDVNYKKQRIIKKRIKDIIDFYNKNSRKVYQK